MALGVNKENYFGYEQYLFVNGVPVPGVQSFQTSFQLPTAPIFQLGGNNTIIAPKGDKVGQANISTFLVSSDPFFNLTGNIGVNGFLIKNLKSKYLDNYSFISGYMGSYSNQYSLGGLPQVQANFQVFSNIGKISSTHPSNITNEINSLVFDGTGLFQDIHQGCATVSFSQVTSNPLISYEFSINVPRIPIYGLKRDTPYHVLLGKPIEINLTMQFEDSDFDALNMKGYPFRTSDEDIAISLKNKLGQTVNFYPLGVMRFVSAQKQSTLDGPDTRTVVYKRYLG